MYKSSHDKIYCFFTTLIIILVLISCAGKEPTQKKKKVDDWVYEPKETEQSRSRGRRTLSKKPTAKSAVQAEASKAQSIGLATGGAKDINNFRRNVKNDYLPLPTDIAYEGLFYDYYFDTGEMEKCDHLFCPSYSYATSNDPISDKKDYYLSVGLNSGLEKKDFERKKLNLVVVLDISGSMGAAFDKYYYDRFGNRRQLKKEERSDKPKMQVASEAVVSLLDHLKPDDQFGMVLFESRAHLAKPLQKVKNTKMKAIKNHIMEITARGGTQMSAGMEKATELFKELKNIDRSKYENRIIFLTDAMPNIGETSEEGLLGITRNNAKNNIYSTFIGIGVDFNSKLVDHITKIKGANYYSVNSSKEFKEKMDEEFEYMVTPLVFDLKLTMDAKGYKIQKVYGSPEANEATGEIMKVNTLFPSKKKKGKTKGGLILLQLKKTSPEGALKLVTSYETREGKEEEITKKVRLKKKSADFFENTGIRKGILLSRYAELLKNWCIDQAKMDKTDDEVTPSIDTTKGIIPPEPIEPELGKWERQSIPLKVSDNYRKVFKNFIQYFKTEMKALNDTTLSQEMDILKKLSTYK